MKWLFFKPIKVFLINCRTEKHNKNKGKKRFVGVTEKYLKTKQSWNTYDGKLSERNSCSECSGILLKMGFVTCEMKVYPWKFSFWTCTKYGFYLIWKSLHVIWFITHPNFFFYKSYWPRLTWSRCIYNEI